jgi:hypothetical protein
MSNLTHSWRKLREIDCPVAYIADQSYQAISLTYSPCSHSISITELLTCLVAASTQLPTDFYHRCCTQSYLMGIGGISGFSVPFMNAYPKSKRRYATPEAHLCADTYSEHAELSNRAWSFVVEFGSCQEPSFLRLLAVDEYQIC